jgi:hypothetical protein
MKRFLSCALLALSMVGAVSGASAAPLMQQISPTPTTYVFGTDYALFNAVAGTFGSVLGDVTAEIQVIPADADTGCQADDFAGFTPGRIALIMRGICAFSTKVNFAQDAGAVGAIIYDNLVEALPNATLSSETFVPSLFITNALANGLITQLRSGDVVIRMNNAPEPGTLALLGLGFAGLAAGRRRKQ